MKKTFINKLRMLDALLKQLENNAEPLSGLPNFSEYVAALTELTTQVGTLYRQQLDNSRGISADKKMAREAMINSTDELVRRCRAYGLNNNDYTRFSAVNLPISMIEKLAQNLLYEFCSKVVQLCTDNLELLGPYGLTQAMIDTATADCETYRQILPAVKVAIANRKMATSEIRVTFSQINEVLKKMDKLVEIVSQSNPEVYKIYKSVRQIDSLKGKSTGNKSTGISGTVVNLSTGKNQEGVTVSIVGANLTTLTDSEGKYSFTLSKAGTYTVSAYLRGYASVVEDDVEVTEGNMTTVDFDIEPETTE